MPLLEAGGLSISFKGRGGPVKVVNNLSFTIGEGSFFGLAGESGSGKSLTALSLLGILPAGASAGGSIRFRGRELIGLSQEEMRSIRGREISMVFQEPMTSLNPVLKIGYQIREALQAHLRISRKEADSRVIELLSSVRIPAPEHRVNDYPHQLSGGMRQRVMIAMAIACGPSLLVADEPTTALDVTIQAQILELINTLKEERNMSVLLITHDLGTIAEHAEQVGVMYAGRLVEVSPVKEIFEGPKHPYTIGLLESIPLKGRRGTPLKPIPGSVPPPWDLPAGCKFSTRCPYVIPGCERQEPELRQVAPGHFARCIRAEEMAWRL
ncbi:MAG: ABC transporter ATP-binding protein [Nitrospiraceae bacterium]|nr:ABC transporter ATP-binding protein [Nitrospiraceae bacterium]